MGVFWSSFSSAFSLPFTSSGPNATATFPIEVLTTIFEKHNHEEDLNKTCASSHKRKKHHEKTTQNSTMAQRAILSGHQTISARSGFQRFRRKRFWEAHASRACGARPIRALWPVPPANRLSAVRRTGVRFPTRRQYHPGPLKARNRGESPVGAP